MSLEWTPPANATGQTIVRERQWGDEWGDETTIETLPGDASGVTDGTVAPSRSYRYRVITTLEDGTEKTSEWVEVTTEDAGLNQRPIPASGPYIEIDHPERESPLVANPLTVNRHPTINDYPTVDVTLPFSEQWHSSRWDEADMQVWYNGDKQPIDTLEHRELSEGNGSFGTTLQGRGGAQLDRRVIEDVEVEPTHEFIEYLIEEYTDYIPDVDDPESDVDEGVVLQSASTAFELEQALSESIQDAIEDDTIPLE
ncbi:hypothetical protein ACFF2X_43425, partial [Cryptosporangium minutisporangium]